MAQFHISKDPLNKTPVNLGHSSFFDWQAQNSFSLGVAYFTTIFQISSELDQVKLTVYKEICVPTLQENFGSWYK